MVEKEMMNILMFPWLAHGHIFPYLELAKAILKRKHNSRIYFCTTLINFDSIRDFVHKNSLHSSIELVQLHLQPSPELPPHYHTTKNLPPSLNPDLIKAFQTSNTSFSDIIDALRPDLVMYDVFQPWASKIASSRGIPAVYFSIFSAATLAYVHHRYTFGKEADFPFFRLEDYEVESLDVLCEFLYANIHDADQDFLWGTFKQSCDFVLVKTSEGIEKKHIDYLSSLSSKKLVPVGPLVSDGTDKIDVKNSEIIQWLDHKNEHSTVFVSFGSEYFLSELEIEEIAKGLEICPVNFIWIIRFPVGVTNITLEDTLPPGFLDRVKDRGMVVTGWAPQAEILAHPSIGGFVSHCGWSSMTESMYFGVPIIAMPMKLDQPINARMLSDVGACVEVRRNENEVFKSEEIAAAMREVFMEGSGEGMRHRGRELSESMKMEREKVLDGVAEEVWELCLKNKLRREIR